MFKELFWSKCPFPIKVDSLVLFHQLSLLLYHLDVPKIVSPPLTSVVLAGQSHNFTCMATGHPEPTIIWTYKMVSVFAIRSFYVYLSRAYPGFEERGIFFHYCHITDFWLRNKYSFLQVTYSMISHGTWSNKQNKKTVKLSLHSTQFGETFTVWCIGKNVIISLNCT